MKKITLLTLCLILAFSISTIYVDYEKDTKLIETDYKVLVDLGQAPNTYSRPPASGDIDTGIVGEVEGIPIRLYASRTWGNNDYGKTFVWRDNLL